MKTNMFIVWPSGAGFETSDLTHWGDLSEAFYRAHLFAAQLSAGERVTAHVTRDDLNGRRLGFGPEALWIPTTALYQISQMGLGSYFDYACIAWVPLPLEKGSENLKELVSIGQ